jgi:plastocyanin
MRSFLAAAVLLFLTVQTVNAGVITGKIEGGKRLSRSPAVVYLANVHGDFKAPAVNPTMDQRKMSFIPHVLPIHVGTTVDYLNNDEVRHNVFSPDREKYNMGTWPNGEVKQHLFTKKGVYSQLCNVHPEMEAFIVVLDTPHFVLTNKDGSYELSNVPAGDYTVKVWHEKLRFNKQQVMVAASDTVKADFTPKKKR